jgi:hypothetical protein
LIKANPRCSMGRISIFPLISAEILSSTDDLEIPRHELGFGASFL